MIGHIYKASETHPGNPIDALGRRFSALRLSLTPVCNLACVYCVEEDVQQGLSSKERSQQLSTEDLVATIARLHERLDLQEIRLTGGEPLLYQGLDTLIEAIRQMGIPKVYMTSNAWLLAHRIEEVADLDGINISLDAVDEETFFKVSRRRHLDRVLAGIDAALDRGIPVKLNAAIMRGVNDNQVLPLLDYARSKNISLRYLELMKMGHLYGHHEAQFFSAQAILEQISSREPVTALAREHASTARYWELPDGYRFGIIANESHPFCQDCNRLRLDSKGHLFGCLSNPEGQAVAGLSDEEMDEALAFALKQKQNLRFGGSTLSMKQIGG